MGVALLCFSICLYLVRYVYDLDHCFENYDRIAELSLYEEANEKGGVMSTPVTLAEELRLKKQDGIEALCVVDHPYRDRPFNVEVKDGKQLPYTFNVAGDGFILFSGAGSPGFVRFGCRCQGDTKLTGRD